MEVLHGGLKPPPPSSTRSSSDCRLIMKRGVSNSDHNHQFPSSHEVHTESDQLLEMDDHGGRHGRQAFAELRIKQQPPRSPQTRLLESDSEEIGRQPWARARGPTRSPLGLRSMVEVDGGASATPRRRTNDEYHRERTSSSSRRRMKARQLRLTNGVYSRKLPELRSYEQSGSESETNVCGSSPEPVRMSESVFQARELRPHDQEEEAAVGPDSKSAAHADHEFRVKEISLGPIRSTSLRKFVKPIAKGCWRSSSSPNLEVRGSFLTPEEVDSAILKLQSNMTEEILGLGREVRMQIIESESRHRRSTRRACKFHYDFLLQGWISNLLRMRYDVLLGRISEKVQDQVQHLENHFLDKLTQASTLLRQSIENHNFYSSSSSSSTQQIINGT